jgi:hypothetical protein
MNAHDIKKVVEQELQRNEPFDGSHGITQQNLRDFLVDPFAVRIDPDDAKSPPREMWVVLQEGRTPDDGYVVIYDPATKSWGFAERIGGRDYSLVCRADSLATALSSM